MSDPATRKDGEPAAPPEAAASVEDLAGLRAKAAERDEIHGKLLRTLADYQNREKRLERERSAWEEERLRAWVGRFLAPMDDLDRLAASEGTAEKGLLEAARLVQRSFLKALADCGIEPIEAAGKPFDPREHEAVGQERSALVAPETVLREVARGYRLRGRVFRPARVVVAAAEGPEPRHPEPEAKE